MNSLVSRITLLLTLVVFGGWSTADAQTTQTGTATTGLAPNTGNSNLTHHQRHAIRTSDGRFHIFLKTELKADGTADMDDTDDDELTSIRLYSSTANNSAVNFAPAIDATDAANLKDLVFGASSSDTDNLRGGVDYLGSDSTCDVIADPSNANVFHFVYNTFNDVQRSGIKYVRLTYSPTTHQWTASDQTQVIKADPADPNGRITYIRPTIAVQPAPSGQTTGTIWLAFIQCDVPYYPVTTPVPTKPSQTVVMNIQYSYRVFNDKNTALTFASDPYAGSVGATPSMPEAGALPAKQKVPTRSIRMLAAGSFVGAVYSDAIDYTFDNTTVVINPDTDKPFAQSAPVKFGLVQQRLNPDTQLETVWYTKDGFFARDSTEVDDVNYVDQFDGDGAHFCAVAVAYGTNVFVHIVTNNGFNIGGYTRYRPSTQSFSNQRPFDVPDQTRFTSSAAYMQICADNAGNLLAVFNANDTTVDSNGDPIRAKPLLTYRSSNGGNTWTASDSALLLPYGMQNPVDTDVPRFDTPAILTSPQSILQQVQTSSSLTFASYTLQ